MVEASTEGSVVHNMDEPIEASQSIDLVQLGMKSQNEATDYYLNFNFLATID